jgi:23S rRNA (adenine-N6)-dimethyltransferase
VYGSRRKLLSQNFFHNRKLVSHLVGDSSIGKKDLVLEIGPGRGIITAELLKRAGYVVAVEIDAGLVRFLRQRFNHHPNLTIYNADILSHPLPRLPYKVFANIPFAIEGKIIRKLLDDSNPPADCHLVTMKALAERLASKTYPGMFGALYRPWFDFRVKHYFSRRDFTPNPHVDSVLMQFIKKSQPLLSWNQRKCYQQFIKRGFSNGRTVRTNLHRWYQQQSIDWAMQKLSLKKNTKPGPISVENWVQLFEFVAKTKPNQSAKTI